MNRCTLVARTLGIEVFAILAAVAAGTYYETPTFDEDRRTYVEPAHQDPSFWE